MLSTCEYEYAHPIMQDLPNIRVSVCVYVCEKEKVSDAFHPVMEHIFAGKGFLFECFAGMAYHLQSCRQDVFEARHKQSAIYDGMITNHF
jgi:hypothetical protein